MKAEICDYRNLIRMDTYVTRKYYLHLYNFLASNKFMDMIQKTINIHFFIKEKKYNQRNLLEKVDTSFQDCYWNLYTVTSDSPQGTSK